MSPAETDEKQRMRDKSPSTSTQIKGVGSETYDFDAVARCGGEGPGAGLLAGIFIWPVGTGDGATHTIHCVITASCKKKKKQNPLVQHRPHTHVLQPDNARWRRLWNVPSLQSCLFS